MSRAEGAHVQPGEAADGATARITSIDALRGFDMFWIVGGVPLVLAFGKIFVNPLPAWFTDQFVHKAWNGFSAEDLIMPLFLFVVGAAMPFSFARRIEQGKSRRGLYLKVIRRVALLWILGMIQQGNLLTYDPGKLRFFSNTLQAIAVGYCLAAILMLNTRVIWQALAIPVLLVTYWLVLVLVPVPGHGAGMLEPEANLALWVDQQILGRFRDGTRYAWILAGLGFTATVLLGVMSGHILRSRRSGGAKVALLAGLGVGSLVAGAIWDRWFPINKHLWTSSMVLWAGGWSCLLLATFHLVIDVLKWRRWAFPLVVIGANAITAYMIGRFIDFGKTSDFLVGHLVPHLGIWGEFVQTLVKVAALWFVLWYMYRNKTFLRI
jgi:predicted acyltransferase